ncbi:MAG: hypothetical protein RBT34_04915 [Anaerolineaceae bacterium]|jgi:hypothetical protein|nr:hypothetical protein [Anaerolineaceae bacterium]
MNTLQEKKRSKSWLWIVGVLLLLLVCCCIAAVAGGYFYLDSTGKTVEDALSGELLEPQVDVPLPQTLEPPLAPDVPPTAAPAMKAEDQIVAVTVTGVWAVNENTGEAVQLSPAPLDVPWNPAEGMSPDGQAFAFITGFGGASISPYLIVLDLAQQTEKLELALTGPLTQPGLELFPGDPAFEATRAMEFTGSLAWSPDGRLLAFVAAIDGDSADVYLYDRVDGSVTRLSDEMGNAAELHWSPDGSFIEYASVESFGTGAGASMLALWAVDMRTREAVLLERLESAGEVFLGWVDSGHFLIHSWGPACSGYNVRVVDVTNGDQQTVVDGCFAAAAYNPDDQMGLMALADYNVENCMCGTPLDQAGVYAFYLDQEPIPMSKVEVYFIDYLPKGNVFTFQPVDEPYAVYQNEIPMNILPEVEGLKPFPASPEGHWAWYSTAPSDDGGELWVTLHNENPVLVSSSSPGRPAWSGDGQTLYFIEGDALYRASAPDFAPAALPDVMGEVLDVVNE